jgi:hypothetical protein
MVPTTEYRSRMPVRLRRLLPWVALVVVAIGFLNFVWFFSESSTIGDAQRGYILDGRYYLVHAGVGTEVSRATWDWSNLHAASLFVTHPLAMAAGAFLLFTVVFPSMTRNGDATVTALRVQRIKASGSATAFQGQAERSASCGRPSHSSPSTCTQAASSSRSSASHQSASRRRT